MFTRVIPTGSILLDKALGTGGLPRGSIITLSGPPGSGKGTLALQATAECQRQGGVAAYIDTEHDFSAHYAEKLGVNLNALGGIRPHNAQEALNHLEELVETGGVSLVVVDSLNALADPYDGKTLGLGHLNRLLNSSLRKLANSAARTKTCVLLLRQSPKNGEATIGGNALDYRSGVQIGINRVEPLGKGGDLRISALIKKAAFQTPREVKLDLISGRGVSLAGELLEILGEKGSLTLTDSGLVYRNEVLGQDRVAARNNLEKILASPSDLRDSLMGVLTKFSSKDG